MQLHRRCKASKHESSRFDITVRSYTSDPNNLKHFSNKNIKIFTQVYVCWLDPNIGLNADRTETRNHFQMAKREKVCKFTGFWKRKEANKRKKKKKNKRSGINMAFFTMLSQLLHVQEIPI